MGKGPNVPDTRHAWRQVVKTYPILSSYTAAVATATLVLVLLLAFGVLPR